ncbi:PqqD family protein [bacterium]|nr:PqqD family protein [bacterium]
MTNYKLNEEKMFADVADGIAIIINSETGIYYGMNKLGTEVYENLINGVSAENILEKLLTWNKDAESKFNEYMEFLTKNGIIIPDSDVQNNIEVSIDEAIAAEDGFIPTVAEYKDVQELLLADPIHEVKEEEGWSPEKSSLNEDKEDVARREAKMELKK